MTTRPGVGASAWVLLVSLGLAAGSAAEAVAQLRPHQPADPAYLDGTAETLHRAAREEWSRVNESVLNYRALVRQRVAAAVRTPLRDRTVYRSEAAHRLFWDQDGGSVFQALGLREQTPEGVQTPDGDWGFFQDAFDPAGDRLLFGLDERREDDGTEGEQDDFEVEHPLGPEATRFYRFRTGDTLTLSLPDGRRLLAVELQVIPGETDPRRISGSLWIDPTSGALIRAAYRLSDRVDLFRDVPDVGDDEDLEHVPGLLKPWTFDLEMVSVDYQLWGFEAWLPRTFRVEGVLGLGLLKASGTMEVSYRMESVLTEGDLEARERGDVPPGEDDAKRFRSPAERDALVEEIIDHPGIEYVVVESDRGEEADAPDEEGVDEESLLLVPADPQVLLASPYLPPAVWEDAPGFPSEDELGDMMGRLQEVPRAPRTPVSWAANWGPQRPDLMRYNRIEGLAVGARIQLRAGSPVGPLSFSLEPFLGVADLDPRARFSVTREDLRRKDVLSVYHELQTVSRRDDPLGLGNSLGALLWGRDEGEYFGATGVDLTYSPPSAQLESWRLRIYAERHTDVDNHTDFSLTHAFERAWSFRPNLEAKPREEAGVELSVRPWWGTDPFAAQAAAELYVQAAEGSEADDGYVRARLLGRGMVPFQLLGRDLRAAVEVEAGRSWGGAPPQRLWYLGGVGTLRGYDASTLVGASFARSRLELAQALPTVSLAVFSDAGWAGPRPRAFRFDRGLVAAGVGVSVLDGLVRLDVSRGLVEPRDTRVDLHMDAAF